MWNHLKVHHPKLYSEIEANPPKLNIAKTASKQTTLTSAFLKMQPHDKKSKVHTDITKVIATFIAEDGMPINTVEKSGFKRMVNFFDKRYQLPSRNYFSRTALPKLYTETRNKILKELDKVVYFSATADGWSSNFVYEPYLSLTVQYVSNDWKMNSVMLETYPLAEDHTGENLAAAMDEALERWGLCKTKLAAMTTDSASNMICACDIMGVVRVACFGHIMHNAIQNSLLDDKVVRAISSCKRLSSAFHTSYKKRTLLAEKQRAHGLPTLSVPGECKTRWMSKFKLVRYVLDNELAIRDALNNRTTSHLIPSVQNFQASWGSNSIIYSLLFYKVAPCFLNDEEFTHSILQYLRIN